MYSVSRMTEGAWMVNFCEWRMWPLCSSTRATPLKIITTARLSVHTFTGSKEVFRTKTLPFISGLILRERGEQCQNYVVENPVNPSNPVILSKMTSLKGRPGYRKDKHVRRPAAP